MSADTTASSPKQLRPDRSWMDMLRVYATPVMAAMIVLGFASGLPLYMVFQKLSYWLRDVGVERSTIGFFYWVTFAYSFKFLWAPVIDRWKVPLLDARLGHRRSWMIVSIAGTVAGLVIIAGSDPTVALAPVAGGALLLAFSGATLDVSIDAWRIESAPTDLQANMAAGYSLGYRFAYMFSGVGLAISEWSNWTVSFLVMAASMAVCAALVLLMREPEHPVRRAAAAGVPLVRRMASMFVEPFRQVLGRLGVWIVPVLALVGVYRLTDFTMGVMAAPLYADLDFSRAVVGGLQSGPGVIATLVGLFLGGLACARLGVMRALLVGAATTFATTCAYAWLAATAGSDDVGRLAVALLADNVSGGYVTTVFIAYLSGLTDPLNAATQYALFSSLFSFFCKFLSGFSGVLADALGYVGFFLLTASYTVPAAALVAFLMLRAPPAAQGHAPSPDKAEPAAA